MSSTQESENNGRFIPTFEEIAEQLGEQRHDILSVLQRSDETGVNTSQLRKAADIPSGSMTHHMGQLERWELVEEIDRVYAGRGSRAIVWTLTQRGEEFCEEWLADTRSVARARDIDELRETQAALDQRMDALEDDVEYIRGVVMEIAVSTGTYEKDKAREAMGEERFREVFGDEA